MTVSRQSIDKHSEELGSEVEPNERGGFVIHGVVKLIFAASHSLNDVVSFISSRLMYVLIKSLSVSLLAFGFSSASFPGHGWVPPSPARLSLSSVDETTEGADTVSSSRAGDVHQWMVSDKAGSSQCTCIHED